MMKLVFSTLIIFIFHNNFARVSMSKNVVFYSLCSNETASTEMKAIEKLNVLLSQVDKSFVINNENNSDFINFTLDDVESASAPTIISNNFGKFYACSMLKVKAFRWSTSNE